MFCLIAQATIFLILTRLLTAAIAKSSNCEQVANSSQKPKAAFLPSVVLTTTLAKTSIFADFVIVAKPVASTGWTEHGENGSNCQKAFLWQSGSFLEPDWNLTLNFKLSPPRSSRTFWF